ncbi:EscF/YscF/HrpA family type III secretion system needle major subunit [Izhakiella australiensis]|uniref:EscF/YscF/HrpA family type III secretion system needle major subunit n=1 Tax=Izhakiella australiensis TaxID=1926881 RepID=A0A1S8YQM2_9GAMM|nr:type III secretion system needle filament subunit SctF [Izhakiella australiensis]OON41076.1 EscF/YscF/HrpA family type III secretion system needle major subunit [Izhakiella australiensis]
MATDVINTPADIGDGRHIQKLSDSFNTGVATLKTKVTTALEALNGNPSDPTTLSNYQAALAEYTLYRNAQSNVVKAYRDIDQSIIANYK